MYWWNYGKSKKCKEKNLLFHTNNNGSGSGRPKSNESSGSGSGTGPSWIPTQTHNIGYNFCWIGCSVADPDAGSGTFLTPGYRMGKKSESGMNIPYHFSESLGTVLGLKIFKYFDADSGSGIFLIRDWKKFESGIWDKHPRSAATVNGWERYRYVIKLFSFPTVGKN
jgi:hypothetical protein